MPGSEGGPSLAYQNLGNDLPTHLPTWSGGYLNIPERPLKSLQGSTQTGHTGSKTNCQKAWLGFMPHDPFPLQNLDKNRPTSSQNFTPILWLVQITIHYKEQLLQNQGEVMVKKGPLESKEDLEGHNRASLTVYSAYLSAYL